MSRHMLSLSHEQLTSFDLDAFVSPGYALNQHHRETFTTRFPKASSRWLSHYAVHPASHGADDARAMSMAASVGSSAPPLTSASPARSVRLTMASEAAPATIRPASSCWRWPPTWISTSIMPTSAAICTKRTRAAATGSWPACTTMSPARMTLSLPLPRR